MKKPKALVLFSGGLDSRITIKLLQEQKIDVEAVYIKLPFGTGCCTNFGCVLNFTQIQGVKLHQIDASQGKLLQEYLNTIKKPKHNRGASMNPCQDCKIFLFKQAKKLAKKINANIIATGEVLGQRPMSQMKKHLLLDEKEAGLENKILRPLSAKLLPETEAEKKGWVDRSKLLDIEGRQRTKQMQLAKHYHLTYPTPSGGCLLCEKSMRNRFKQILKRKLDKNSVKFLSIGRHFLIDDSWIILGRNEKENIVLENTKTGKLINPEFMAPSARYFGKIKKSRVIELIKAYSNQEPIETRKKFEQFRL